MNDALDALPDQTLSPACERHVRRVETRSSCGRPGKVVCCRTSAAGRTTASIRREGFCRAPRNGAACESSSPYVSDACTADGCTPEPQCGDGVVAGSETCDPPDGVTCSDGCTSCAPESGQTLLGCSSTGSGVHAAATANTFLVAYTDRAPVVGARSVAKRLGNDGAALDQAPIEVSTVLPGSTAVGGATAGATSDGSGFHVGWSAYADFHQHLARRSVPASGPVVSGPVSIAQHLVFGSCGVSISGPLGLAPSLDGNSVHASFRNVYYCAPDVLMETLTGVGDFFSVPPPGIISSGPAPLARGASDVAAVWWAYLVPSVSPPVFEPFLAASWIEPGPPAMITLTDGTSPVAPAVAAAGDVFLAVFASGNEVRGVRFTRVAGPLDPDGGFAIASGAGPIGSVAAASDGSAFVVAWQESTGPSQSAVRAIRVAFDGTLPDPTPELITGSGSNGSVSVAANPTTALIAFTRAEGPATSVRAALLGD